MGVFAPWQQKQAVCAWLQSRSQFSQVPLSGAVLDDLRTFACAGWTAAVAESQKEEPALGWKGLHVPDFMSLLFCVQHGVNGLSFFAGILLRPPVLDTQLNQFNQCVNSTCTPCVRPSAGMQPLEKPSRACMMNERRWDTA